MPPLARTGMASVSLISLMVLFRIACMRRASCIFTRVSGSGKKLHHAREVAVQDNVAEGRGGRQLPGGFRVRLARQKVFTQRACLGSQKGITYAQSGSPRVFATRVRPCTA